MERFVPGISCWLLPRKQRIPAIMWTMHVAPRPAASELPSPSTTWLKDDSTLERLPGSAARVSYGHIWVSLRLLPPSLGCRLQESNSWCYWSKHPTTAPWGILSTTCFARKKTHACICYMMKGRGAGQMRWDCRPNIMSVVSPGDLKGKSQENLQKAGHCE